MAKEFIRLGHAEVLAFEETMRVQKHLDRYFTIRQFCYGRVLDIACGTGYGSYIIGTNPKVLGVLGVDKNEESIAFAQEEFSERTEGCEHIHFSRQTVENFYEMSHLYDFETLVSIETIEHLEDPTILGRIAKRTGVKTAIISYPTKESVFYNSFHKYDLLRGDIEKIFKGFSVFHAFDLGKEVEILIFSRRYDVDTRKFYAEES